MKYTVVALFLVLSSFGCSTTNIKRCQNTDSGNPVEGGLCERAAVEYDSVRCFVDGAEVNCDGLEEKAEPHGKGHSEANQ